MSNDAENRGQSRPWLDDNDQLESILGIGKDEKHVFHEFWADIEHYLPFAEEEIEIIIGDLRRKYPVSKSKLKAPEAHQYLSALRLKLIESVQPYIQQLSPSTWLWYLRRIDPSVVYGVLTTTPINVMRVAENISMYAKRSFLNDQIRTETPFSFRMDASNARRVSRLIAIAENVNLLENHIRRAAKGQTFDFKTEGQPVVVEDEGLENALSVFDARTAEGNAIVWHPSIEYYGISEPPRLNRILAIATRDVHGWGERTGWVRISDNIDLVEVYGQFDLRLSALSETKTSIDLAGSAAGMREPRVAACLVALSNAVARYVFTMPHVGAVVPAAGYVIIHHDDLIEYLRVALEDTPWAPLKEIWSSIGPKDVIKTLKRHPLAGHASKNGSIIRSCLVGHMVDLFSLSCEIFEVLRVDSQYGGDWVNAGAFDFELAVQRVIDASHARPSSGVSNVRGLTLLGPDGPITDIDAVMEIDSILIIVSCKKVESSQDFDRGVHQRIRNNESTIVSALKEWEKVVDYLRTSPIGSNYDFSRFDDILGIVISPGTVFLNEVEPLEQSDALPRGLRSHMSYSELVSALIKTP